jgi:hypothetical protein
LKDFFARWVYGTGHPQYQLQWSSKNAQNAVILTVTLEQTQAGEPFLDPVPIEFTVNGKKQPQMIYPKTKLTTTEFRLDANPTSVQLDPGETLLKEVIAK